VRNLREEAPMRAPMLKTQLQMLAQMHAQAQASKKPPPSSLAFLPARAKLWLGSLDNPKLEVRAQYNPKELQIDKQVPWEESKARDNRSGPNRTERNRSVQSDLTFNGAPKRSMTVELLFDTYEIEGASVEPDIRRLEEMSSVQDPETRKPERRRPHHCIVAWGDSNFGMRPFRCVIESLAVKYTMWDHDGTPKRATCTVKLKEAHQMDGAHEAEDHYAERRRWAGSEQARPKNWETARADAYTTELARDRDRVTGMPAKKDEEAGVGGGATATVTVGTAGAPGGAGWAWRGRRGT
jgi:hypothetical protein